MESSNFIWTQKINLIGRPTGHGIYAYFFKLRFFLCNAFICEIAVAADESASEVGTEQVKNVAVNSNKSDYQIQFQLRADRTGLPSANTRYRITLENGKEFIGVSDAGGMTQLIHADSPITAKLEAPYQSGDRIKLPKVELIIEVDAKVDLLGYFSNQDKEMLGIQRIFQVAASNYI
ncbi:hypothetical protein [Undibacterium sp. GrIS 1.2]|uniref:hypothetical protein n=1 Tax=Undibacterium sp. GrIS 1.2 TaxID=3143933 RepID=UPI0033959995